MADSTTGWCRLILARHGQTLLNARDQLRGHLDPDLDEMGRREVAALAQALTQYDVQVVRHSPLLRARRTAEAIAAASGVTAEPDERLIDRDYGQWAGHSKAEVVEQWGSLSAAPGVEPPEAVLHRAVGAVNAYADQPGVVLVAHDAVNQLVLTHIDASLGTSPRQRTACWNVLQHKPSRGWQVIETDRVAPVDAGGHD
jgi:broad specificity phosphatase PhoE